jgi:hypothetical protein
MTISTIETSSSTERVEIASTTALLARVHAPLTADVRGALLRTLASECAQIAGSVRDREFATLCSMETNLALVQSRQQQARETSQSFRESTETALGSWAKVVIWSLCGLACFAAEFVLSWRSLCFVLNVDRASVLGILLGLAPPSGLAVLEVVLARLFEEPWQRLRATGGGRRWLVTAAMGVLLMSLAAGNVMMVVHLAKAREEAARVERILSDPDDPGDAEIDQAAIDRAVLSVSLLVTLDGAVFLLLSLQAGAELGRRLNVQRSHRKSVEDHTRLESELSKATIEAERAREAWKTVEETGVQAAERYRAHCLYLLAEKEASLLSQPIEEIVERSIRMRIPV